MLSSRRIGKWIVNETLNKKLKLAKKKRKSKKRIVNNRKKEFMINQFGKARYYLSYWFGQWVLYV